MAGRGIKWERVCNNSREFLAQEGRISWLRMHPPVVKCGPGVPNKRGSFTAIWAGKGPPDWCALADGIAILGDDKDSRSGPWGSWNVKKHQAKAFDEHERQGGISCVPLRMPDRTRWCIPWQMLKPYWENRCRITETELTEMGALPWIAHKPDQPRYDWLAPLLKWREECLGSTVS